MIELISYGNLLRSGRCAIHSRFSSVVNFTSHNRLVSVVSENIGGGPLNIVLKGIVPASIETLEIDETHVTVNNTKLPLHTSKGYNPFFISDRYDIGVCNRNIVLFEKTLVQSAPQNSLTFFLNSNFTFPAESTFEYACLKKLEAGMHALVSGDVHEGVKMLKGLGQGLTPSGDDCIVGYMTAMHVAQKILKTDMTETIESIYEIAKSSSVFTDSLLYCASKGFLFDKFKKLIDAVLSGTETEVVQSVEQVLTVGHSSGADQAVGFLLGTKKLMKNIL